MLVVEALRKMICVRNLVHKPLFRGKGSPEKLSRTESLPLQPSAEMSMLRGKLILTGFLQPQALRLKVLALSFEYRLGCNSYLRKCDKM